MSPAQVPGAKWWKCDLHVHTDASSDVENYDYDAMVAAAEAVGLEAIAIVDHNAISGIDRARAAVARAGSSIVIFPGVELTVAGLHLLAVFDPSSRVETVTAYLGECGIRGGQLGTDAAMADCTTSQAMARAVRHGGVAVLAHADDAKGCLKVVAPGQDLMGILTDENLVGVEVSGSDTTLHRYIDGSIPEYSRRLGSLARIESSDSHDPATVGDRATWVKMSLPSIEGLRLALHDGNLYSVKPVTAGLDPNAQGAFSIESVNVSDAQYIGRGSAFEMQLSPWLSAVIGGRGTGKSTLVEMLRIALAREHELPDALRADFDALKKIPATRGAPGLLTENTIVTVVYVKEGARYRIVWRATGDAATLEKESAGEWVESPGDIAQRFPVGIFSQKHIFELARDPEALLHIVDDAHAVARAEFVSALTQAQTGYLKARAEVRELEARFLQEPVLRGQLEDIDRSLDVFEQAGHTDVRKAFARRSQQDRLIEEYQDSWTASLTEVQDALQSVTHSAIGPPDFDAVDSADGEVTARAASAEAEIGALLARAESATREAMGLASQLVRTLKGPKWTAAHATAMREYEALRELLEAEGVGDVDEYGRLVGRKREVEAQLDSLAELAPVFRSAEEDAARHLAAAMGARRAITRSRSEFLHATLGDNPHVRISAVPYGAKARAERSFRSAISRSDSTFAKDVSSLLDGLYYGYPPDGPASDRDVESFEARLKDVKARLKRAAGGIDEAGFEDRRFVAHIAGLAPEALDRLDCWFPEDELRPTYSPGANGEGFRPIHQGSPGQKTAALLAFLLSYGVHPIVLDQPEDDLDNQLIYDLVVKRIRTAKGARQVVVVTHNANVVVNGDAELVVALNHVNGQTAAECTGGLQEQDVRDMVCLVMEGGREAFELRYKRIGDHE